MSQPLASSQSRTNCLSNESGTRPPPTAAAGQNRDESGVSTSSTRITVPSAARPHSNLVSARTMPLAAAWAAPRLKTSRLFALSKLASSEPMLSAMTANETFSSWPLVAFVAGVKIGSGSSSPAESPGGSLSPQTVPLRRYSAQPLPASRPRTTHSNGITSAARTSIDRPRSGPRSTPAGSPIASTSVVIRWWGTGRGPLKSQSNQWLEMAVSTRPLSGIGVGRIQSKALIRSVETISIRASPPGRSGARR